MTQNKSILITGASSGIGKYACSVFSSRGWVVWAGYRDNKVKNELISINEKIRPIKIDVTKIDSILDARNLILNSGLELNVLINNAGIAIGGPIEILDIEDIKKVYDVNLFGSVQMIQKFLPLLRKSHGRIVNMSSMGGLVGVPFLMPYSSSKFAIEGISDILRRELYKQGVKVCIIEPGPVDTSIWSKSLENSKQVFENDNEILNFYQPAVSNLNSLISNSGNFSISLNKMKKVLIHSVESKNPKTRYLVYRHNMLLRILIKITPDKIVDLFFRKYIKY